MKQFSLKNQYAATLTCMQQRAAAGAFFIFFYNRCHFLLKIFWIMNLYQFSVIFDEKNNMQHFGLYAASMQQYAAAVVWIGVLKSDILFIL